MPASRVLQFLSIPAALGLGTALVLACSDGGPTAPADQLSPVQTATPFTAPKKGGTGGKDTVVDDVDLTCKNNYVLRPRLLSPPFMTSTEMTRSVSIVTMEVEAARRSTNGGE
jgi:hypothetical protein